MVSKLEYKNNDPDRKGRGAGYYWRRTPSFISANGYGYSKYTGKHDSSYKADYPSKAVRKALGSKGRAKMQKNYPHAGDYSTAKSKMRIGRRPKGFY